QSNLMEVDMETGKAGLAYWRVSRPFPFARLIECRLPGAGESAPDGAPMRRRRIGSRPAMASWHRRHCIGSVPPASRKRFCFGDAGAAFFCADRPVIVPIARKPGAQPFVTG